MIEIIEHQAIKTSAEKLAMFLMDLSKAHHGRCEFELPHKKSTIASHLGMKPETLSRSLAKLRDLGVDTDSRNVTIRDMRLLSDFAEGRLNA